MLLSRMTQQGCLTSHPWKRSQRQKCWRSLRNSKQRWRINLTRRSSAFAQMVEGSTRKHSGSISRRMGSFMRQQYLTLLIKMESASGQIKPSWTGFVQSLLKQVYPRFFGWKSQQQLSISRIAALHDLSKARHHMKHGLGASQISLISRFWGHLHTFMCLKRSESSLTHTPMWASLLATAVQQIIIEFGIKSERMWLWQEMLSSMRLSLHLSQRFLHLNQLYSMRSGSYQLQHSPLHLQCLQIILQRSQQLQQLQTTMTLSQQKNNTSYRRREQAALVPFLKAHEGGRVSHQNDMTKSIGASQQQRRQR